MALKDKCRSCGKQCESFFIHNGKILCDNCFIKLANKHLRYKLKMQKLNAILAKIFIVALIVLAFVCGVMVGLL